MVAVHVTPSSGQTYVASDGASFNTAVGNVNTGGGSISIANSFSAVTPTAATSNVAINLNANTLGITGMGGATGSLNVQSGGTGVLSLTGTNTFNGLRVTTSTVQLDGDAALGSGSLTLNSATLRALSDMTIAKSITLSAFGATIDTQGFGVTFAGQVGGTSPLYKTGSGTLTLNGLNTYQTGTTVLQGQVTVGNAGALGANANSLSITGGVVDLGGFNVVQNGGLTLTSGTLQNGTLSSTTPFSLQTGSVNAVLAGSASLIKTGVGTVTLSGVNTYTGTTTISGGTLALSGAGSISSSSNVAVNSIFDISATSVGTSVKTLSGNGIVSLGGRTLTVTSGSTSFGGGISGTGGLRLTGGAQTLSGSSGNSYSGTTVIEGGTLVGGAANAFSASSVTSVAAGGTLNLGGFAQRIDEVILSGGTLRDGALTGTVSSTGGAIDGLSGPTTLITTAGVTIATGTNTYTGATNVNGGTLEVDGTITVSNVTVNNGGTLSGTGKIGDPQINAGGTLSPGSTANPTGTLTIVGPLGFAAGSFYNVAINLTANSRTNVVGTTTIAGGTVQVLAGSGTYATNTRYTILTSTGGVAGTFTRATANTNFAFLTPTLSYDANDVYLTVLPSTPIVTTNPTTGARTTVPDYRTAAGTQNQRAVAGGLTQAGIQNGGTGRVLTALNQLTAPQARAAFDSLSGEGLTAAQNIANRSAELFTSSIFDQTTFYGSGNAANAITLTEPIRELADLPSGKVQPPVFVQPNRTWRAWATGFGGVDDIHGNGQTGSSYQQNTIYGGTLGVDYQLMPNYLVGVAIGGTNGDFLVPGRATSGSTTGGHVAFYDLATFGSFYGASSTSFSYFGNRATRTVSGFGGLGTETERANFNSNEFRTRLEFGRHLAGYGGVLTPFVALELAQLRSNGFTENAVQGAGLFRLNVSGQSQASAPAFVGLRLQRATSLGNGITLSPTLQVAYVHEFAPYRSQIGTLADLPGSTFLIDGARPARNAAQVKAGAEMAIGARSMIFANFDGEFSGVNQLYAGKGGFRYMW